MNKCTECGSYAINHHCHGRDGSDPELCDVCYWRVRATDYATLEAKCERLKNLLLAITTRHFAESWKKRTSDAELEQYLSAGIAQLEAERDTLRQQLAEQDAEIERLRMQLVACGVVALANTPKSAGEARQMHPDYMSASCSDVANAVDREMTMRQQRDKLAGLLDRVTTEVGRTITSELREEIDAAIAEANRA